MAMSKSNEMYIRPTFLNRYTTSGINYGEWNGITAIIAKDPEKMAEAIVGHKKTNKLLKALTIISKDGTKMPFIDALTIQYPEFMEDIFDKINPDLDVEDDVKVKKLPDALKKDASGEKKAILHHWIDYVIKKVVTFNKVNISKDFKIFDFDVNYIDLKKIFPKFGNKFNDKDGTYQQEISINTKTGDKSMEGGASISIMNSGAVSASFSKYPIQYFTTKETEKLVSILEKFAINFKGRNFFEYSFKEIVKINDNNKIEIILENILNSCLKSEEYSKQFINLLIQVDYQQVENNIIKQAVGKFAIKNDITELQYLARNNHDNNNEDDNKENDNKEDDNKEDDNDNDDVKKDSESKPKVDNIYKPSNAATSDDLVNETLNNNDNNTKTEVTITGATDDNNGNQEIDDGV